MDRKISSIKIDGDGNLVIQGIENSQITVNNVDLKEILQIYTKDLREEIKVYQELLQTKEKLYDLERLNFSEKINTLQSELNQKEQQIREIIRQNSDKDLERSSSMYNNALGYFLEGNIEMALKELDEDVLAKEKKYLAESRLLKARILALDFRFDEAEYNYQKAIELLPSWDNYMAISLHHIKLNQFDLAELNYNKALEHANNQSEKAITLNDLGNVYISQNSLESAEKCFNEAIDLYEELDTDEPSSDLSGYAAAYTNLATIYLQRNEVQLAEKFYYKALNIHGKSIKDPLSFTEGVAIIQRNLGSLYSLTKNFSEAEGHLSEALRLFKHLQSVFGIDFSSKIGGIYDALGTLSSDRNNYSLAKIGYSEALKIFRTLADKNPAAYLPPLGLTLNNLGVAQKNLGEYDDAEASYKEALEINRGLSELNPSAYNHQLSLTLNNLGNIHGMRDEYDKALEFFNETLQITLELAIEHPKKYMPDLAKTSTNIARVEKNREKFDVSRKHYLKAIVLYKRMVKYNPQTYLPEVALKYNDLAEISLLQNDFKKAEKYYEKSVDILRNLPSESSLIHSKDLAFTLSQMGGINYNKDNIETAETYIKEAIELNRKRSKSKLAEDLADLGGSLINLAKLYLYKTENFSGASKLLSEAHKIFRKLSKENDLQYLSFQATIAENFGTLYLKTGKYRKARNYHNEAISLNRKFNDQNPTVIKDKIAKLQYNLAKINIELGSLELAEITFKDSLDSFKELSQENPSEYSQSVTMGLMQISQFYQDSKPDKSKSLQFLKEAINILATQKESPFKEEQIEKANTILSGFEIKYDDFISEG